MIEVLLEAERALSHGLVDRAEQLYRQVSERDPRSSIALVGLARVALERDDALGAYLHARKAQAIDPENPAANHLVMRMSEVLAGRGEAVPDGDSAAATQAVQAAAAGPPPGAAATEPPVPDAGPATPEPDVAAEPPRSGYRPPTTTPRSRPGIIGRLLGRRRR
jgi:hypothetical protein